MVHNRLIHLVTVLAILSNVSIINGEITEEQVRRSIERGVRFLKDGQQRRGNWPELAGYPGGVTALCTLALLNSGVPVDDGVMNKALNNLRNLNSNDIYVISLQTMVLCQATPKRDRRKIADNVRKIQISQCSGKGPHKGGWTYSTDPNPSTTDNSNSQFALLALYEAERIGVEVDKRVWRLARNYWTNQQNSDGSWSYQPVGRGISLGSMTCAGIASVIIASGQIGEGDASVDGEEIKCCGAQMDNDAVQRGMSWLGRHFSVRKNPSTLDNPWWLYYLYAMERVGRLSGQRFIGSHDWYREGAEYLIRQQDPTGAWTGEAREAEPNIGTSLGLLFLSKGRRAVLISKAQRPQTEDWNLHRHDLNNLTRHVESLWRRDMTWQTVDIGKATIEDLLQTPVLFISGRDSLDFAKDQKELLKSYVAQGGFILAEAACGGQGFDRDFRALVAELFPESELRILPPDHPIWYAEQKVDPRLLADRPLYGLEACCRTSVVYCQGDLSCLWELAGNRDRQSYSKNVRKKIDTCLAVGANVVTYATNRELRGKLDIPQVFSDADANSNLQRATLSIAKLMHNGGYDDAPAALSNLLRATRHQLQVRVNSDKRILPMTASTLPDFPMAFLHGRRHFQLSKEERKALAEYIENGGFLFADSICANPDFANAFRREMRSIFPGHRLQQIAPDHPMFTTFYQGTDITTVRLRDPSVRQGNTQRLDANVEFVPPTLEGIEIDGRIVVVFSPFDISCALENQASLQCKGYVAEDAIRIGINVILFAMQQ